MHRSKEEHVQGAREEKFARITTVRSHELSKSKIENERVLRGREVDVVLGEIRRGLEGSRLEWLCLQRNEDSAVICKQIGLPPRMPGYVVVRTTAAAVCQADRRVLIGQKEALNALYVILGHEGVGVVVWADHDNSHLLGEKVIILPHIRPENHEQFCKAYASGDWCHCPHSKHMGFDVDGTFAEYLSVPIANAQPIPLEVQRKASEATVRLNLPGDTVLALIEPLACVKTAVDMLMRAKREFQNGAKESLSVPRDRALLIGCGVMSGIWAIELSNLGYEISLLDKNLDRARMLNQQLTFRSEICTGQKEENFDLVVVNASDASASSEAFEYVKDEGVVYLFSGINNAKKLDVRDPDGYVELERVHRKGGALCEKMSDGRRVTISGSSGYNKEAFNSAVRDVGNHASAFTQLITGVIYGMDGRKVWSLIPGVPDFEDSKPVLPTILGDWKRAAQHLKVVVIHPKNESRIFIGATVNSFQIISRKQDSGHSAYGVLP